MKKYFQALSAVLSIVLAGSACGISAFAVDSSTSNYSTFTSESKDLTQKNVSEKNNASTRTSDDPFDVFEIYFAHINALNPAYNFYRNSWGIDVSEHQGPIDWYDVKNSGVEFAIIRAGCTQKKIPLDDYFVQNMAGAQEVGMDVGTYWFITAENIDEAYDEAEQFYEIIKNYDFQYPVYLDIEDLKYQNFSATEVSYIIDAFCSRMKEKGYYVGIYSYSSFLNTKVYDFIFDKYDVWVAEYGAATPNFNREYRMWQYASSGCGPQVNGINTYDLDLNHCYVDYPYLITGRKDNSSTVVPGNPSTGNPVEPPTETPEDPPVYIEQTIETTGINVSQRQGYIDWYSVAQDNVDFAILAAGYGKYATQKDAYFEQNYYNAKSAGIDVGAYWYSYAVNTADALQEAELFYQTIAGHQFEYPLYVQLDESTVSGLSNSEISKILKTFCGYLESKGYYVGIMNSENFLKTRVENDIINSYSLWISKPGDTAPVFKKFYGMWQYSFTGTINGIQGNVLCNYCYDTFPQIMKDVHLNGY